MNEMLEKFSSVWPEVSLLVGAMACLITGLSSDRSTRKATVWVAAISLLFAGLLAPDYESRKHGVFALFGLAPFIKLAVVGLGLILLLISAGAPAALRQNREADAAINFEPGDSLHGEYFAFMLLSLAGVMFTAGATDLVWLFLALELTSLPTYVLVAIGRDRATAQESAVKYFFLGAFSTAIFLYGFTLIYGATGLTELGPIAAYIKEQPHSNSMFVLGLGLAITGICFKIAAVPMHFYAADVYQGASTPVAALLAFAPKAAGFAAMVLILQTVGWQPLPATVMWLLWIIAALTMTIGNILGLLQQSVKRTLAYSSVAHSGYLLIGVLAGPGLTGGAIGDGIAAVFFYLVAYGLGTIGAFAVLGCLSSKGEQADSYDDISGLARRHPVLGATMIVSVLTLLGMPPLVGFLGKIYLFGSGIEAEFIGLVVIALINSAISAGYYLRIASVCFFAEPSEHVDAPPALACRSGAVLAAVAAVALGFVGGSIIHGTSDISATIRPNQSLLPPSPAMVEPPGNPLAAKKHLATNSSLADQLK